MHPKGTCSASLHCVGIAPYAPSAGGKNTFKRRPLAATYLCRSAAKARFDNRSPRGVRFPKGRGRDPSLLVVSRKGDFQGGREIEIPSPLNGVLWILSFAKERKYPVGDIKRRKKKVSRGRQKRKRKVSRRRQKKKAPKKFSPEKKRDFPTFLV